MPALSLDQIRALFSLSPFSLRQEFRLLSAGGGRGRMALTVSSGHTQGLGRVHGGIVRRLADTAAAFAAYSLIDGQEQLLTTNLPLSFTSGAGAGAGDEMVAEGRIIHSGRTTVAAETSVARGDEATMASGLFTMIRMKAPEPVSSAGG